MDTPKRLYLSDTDRKLAGVCGGFAEYFGIDATPIRLIWVLVTLISMGAGLLGYLVCAMVIPHRDKEVPKSSEAGPQ